METATSELRYVKDLIFLESNIVNLEILRMFSQLIV